MTHLFQVSPQVFDAVKNGALSARDLPDQALKLLGTELAAAQDALLGVGHADTIPLPMPNVVYLLLALLEHEAIVRGSQPTTWRAFRILGELHRAVEAEGMNRFFQLVPEIPPRDTSEIIRAAIK